MESAQLRVFSAVRRFSSISAATAIALSILFSSWLGNDSMQWQVALAIAALAIGIPHGALDHLVTLPRKRPWVMTIFIAIYIAVALLAIWAILTWNVIGFIAVVLMSATHFGVGDSAFIRELNTLQGSSAAKLPILAYAPAAGILPVFIPLISDRSSSALEQVNPALINWDHGFASLIQIAIAAMTTLSLLVLISQKRWRDVVDLLLLAGLASFAPPLVAFAVYFGCWHAMRHTARLTSLLPASHVAYSKGSALIAFSKAVIPGLPALAGTLIFVGLLAAFSQTTIDGDFLWLTLVTVWALTVPHMIVTARLDRTSLKL